MSNPLHLVRVPFHATSLVSLARHRGFPLNNLDFGYLAHCAMREAWRENAPSPFVLRSQGRTLDAWGYSSADATSLVAQAHSTPPSSRHLAMSLDRVCSRPVPLLSSGKELRLLVRTCPIVRLAKSSLGHRAGAELDVYLARCLASEKADDDTPREAVYRNWLTKRLGGGAESGFRILRLVVAGMSRERFMRRTQGSSRRAQKIERPDVRFEIDATVTDGERLRDCLRRGIGRHRSFGFGALMLAPLGTPYQGVGASC